MREEHASAHADETTREPNEPTRDADAPNFDERRRTPGRLVALAAAAAIGLGLLLSTMASCNAPTVTTATPPPPVYVAPAPAPQADREKAARAFIAHTGTYGWDSMLGTWEATAADMTTSTDLAEFPLVGPRYGRCISEQCHVTVTSVVPIPDAEEFTYEVTQARTTTAGASPGTTTAASVWAVTVDAAGKVTRVSRLGLG